MVRVEVKVRVSVKVKVRVTLLFPRSNFSMASSSCKYRPCIFEAFPVIGSRATIINCVPPTFTSEPSGSTDIISIVTWRVSVRVREREKEREGERERERERERESTDLHGRLPDVG
jgi:hypothetical protein